MTHNRNVEDTVENERTNNQEPNPNTNPNKSPNTEGEQDQNSQILAHLGALRCLSSFFREGYRLRQSLSEALHTITNTISNSQGALYNIISDRESMRKYYYDGLSYKDIKKLKITKDNFFHYSRTLAPDWFHPRVDHKFS